ncbi:MAG TPA: ATP-binding protein [Thermoanaerobaculia bacterium]|nr:ATP-binding protein [Thermoanaerobaculia bacterium]
MKKPILLSWSGGKDSALALHALRSSPDFEPAGLLTTMTEGYDRISIHGVRRELLERQAEAIGLPLRKVWIPKDCSNEIYEARLATALREVETEGIHHVAFGDLFLRDVRDYREQQMAALGLEPVCPVWGIDTAELARDFLRLGFEAVLVCVDTEVLDPAFAGRSFDEALLRDLPAGVDPCGENGELHTFVHAGPIFRQPLAIKVGRVEGRGRFWFHDLELSPEGQAQPVDAAKSMPPV